MWLLVKGYTYMYQIVITGSSVCGQFEKIGIVYTVYWTSEDNFQKNMTVSLYVLNGTLPNLEHYKTL